MRKDEDFIEILIRRIKTTISSTRNSISPHSSPSMRPGVLSVPNTMETNGNRVSVVENKTDLVNKKIHRPDVKESLLLGSKNGEVHEKTDAFNGKVISDQTYDKLESNTGTQEERPSLTSMKTVILH